jgi:CcmD family protein
MRVLRLIAALSCVVAFAAPALAMQPPAATSEYVPVKDLPPVDQVPAAPLLIAAYAFVWIAAMFYMWTIWRRLNRVETEMQALARKSARR